MSKSTKEVIHNLNPLSGKDADQYGYPKIPNRLWNKLSRYCEKCGEAKAPTSAILTQKEGYDTQTGEQNATLYVEYDCPSRHSKSTAGYYFQNKKWNEITGGIDSCFIATACYGTALHGDLDVLRYFRDAYMPELLVSVYYRTSPPIANFIAKYNILRFMIRQPIRLMVISIRKLTRQS